MRTIGAVLRQKRQSRKLSIGELEKETKIKGAFIESIEEERWEKLPEYPAVQGFVKSITKTLGLKEEQTMAMLRRDYPPEKGLQINPKPDVGNKLIWSPKLTFITGVTSVLLVIVSYLAFQYFNFITPPKLEVEEPEDGQVVTQRNLVVSGNTDANATVRVNNQPVLIEEDGFFTTEVEIFEGTKEIVVKAVSRSGKETVVHRNIKPELREN
jgi:cytoskeletal protein RodZ